MSSTRQRGANQPHNADIRQRQAAAAAITLVPGAKGAYAAKVPSMPSDPANFAAMKAVAYADLTRSGAHYIIDSVADLDAVIDDIEGRLARGERP